MRTGDIYQKHETKGVLYSLQLSKEFEHFGQFLVYLSVIRILKADENDNVAVKKQFLIFIYMLVLLYTPLLCFVGVFYL